MIEFYVGKEGFQIQRKKKVFFFIFLKKRGSFDLFFELKGGRRDDHRGRTDRHNMTTKFVHVYTSLTSNKVQNRMSNPQGLCY